MEQSRNKKQEEASKLKVKEQEQKDLIIKAEKERDDAFKRLGETRAELEKVRKERQKT